MRLRLAQRSFSGIQVAAGRIHRGLIGLQAGDRVLLGLRAVDALRGQSHDAGGVCLLMLVIGLGLLQRSLRGLYLRRGHGGCAHRFTAVLAFCLLRLAQMPLVGRSRGLGGFERRIQVVAFNGGDQLPGLHRIAFFDRQRPEFAGNPRADHYLVRVHRPDELQFVAARRGHQVPDQRPHREDTENHKNSIACVHLAFPSNLLMEASASGMGVSASTRREISAPRCRSMNSAWPRN